MDDLDLLAGSGLDVARMRKKRHKRPAEKNAVRAIPVQPRSAPQGSSATPASARVNTEPSLLEIERAGRHRAERALQQYWALLDTLLANTSDLFTLKNADGRYQAASGSFCSFCGLSEAELRGKTDRELFQGGLADLLSRHDAFVISQARPQAWEEWASHGGADCLFHIRKSPVADADGHVAGVLSVLRDVTALRRAQRQAQALARFAVDPYWVLDTSGAILDVSDTYCVLTGYRREELLGRTLRDLEVLSSPHEEAGRCRRVRRQGWGRFRTLHRARSARILELSVTAVYAEINGGRFFYFFQETGAAAPVPAASPEVGAAAGKRDHAPLQVVSLNDIVRQTLAAMLPGIPPRVQTDQDLDPELWNCMANPVQIAQVLRNLVTNAVEAIDGRGGIGVRTRNLEIERDLARLYAGLRPGRYAYLSIEDTGRGISAGMREKIFEPFITSKEKGRGMGLASVRRNVKDHGGHILLKSREGAGSTFSVFLPATDAKVHRDPSLTDAPVGTETILLIEHEPYALNEARQMLERLAYRVLPAQDIAQALHIARSHSGSIELALLSTRVPGIEDLDIVPILRRTRPETRILLCGAEDLDRLAQDLLDAGADSFLQKPLRVDVLAPKIRQVLDA